MSLSDKIHVAFHLLTKAEKDESEIYARLIPGLPYNEIENDDGEDLKVLFIDIENPGK